MSIDLQVETRSPTVQRNLANIYSTVAAIKALSLSPEVDRRFTRLNLAHAVRATIGIEGIELSVHEIAQVMAAPPDVGILEPERRPDEQAARNAAAVMEHIAQHVRQQRDAPLTEELILRFHRILTTGVGHPNNEPGRYRKHAVVVGSYRPPAMRCDG